LAAFLLGDAAASSRGRSRNALLDTRQRGDHEEDVPNLYWKRILNKEWDQNDRSRRKHPATGSGS
jgi:hypothetical protein